MNDEQQQPEGEQPPPSPSKQPEFQLGGVNRNTPTEDQEFNAQTPYTPRQTLVIGLQDEDKQQDDPSKPGKTTLVIGPEYQEEKKKKKQEPIKYATASQQAVKENKLPLYITLAIAAGVLLVIAGIAYVVYINFFDI